MGCKSTNISLALKVVLLTLLALLFISPFTLVLLNAVKTQGEVIINPFSFPQKIQWANFPKAWNWISLGKSLVNTSVVTFFSSVLLVYFAAKVSYWCTRHSTRFSRIFETLLVSSVLIPFSSIMLPVVKLLSMLKLTGTLWGGVTAYTGMGMAFSYFVMRGSAKSIPKEIEDAAMVDGCSPYGIFYRIILPLMVPTAVSVFILEVFWVWNDYNISIILLNTKFTKTIQVTIHALFAQTYSKWDIALPALVMSMLPIMAANIVLQKKIFAGMTAGAIKG